MKSKLFYILAVPTGLIFFVLFTFSCMKMRTSNQKTFKQFKKLNQPVFIDRIGDVRVIKSDTFLNKTAIVFIHGTPGSADAYYEYLQDTILTSKFTVITLDRLGYGYSQYGQPEVDISKQAESIKKIIEPYKNVIAVGHSYGGAIAAELTYQSENVSTGVLLAPAMFPHKEKFYGGAKLGQSKVGKLFVSKAIYVASVEKINHENSLKGVESHWKEIKKHILYIHSTDDKIVPYQVNFDYIQQAFPSSKLDTITLHEGNHFLPWNHHELVRSKLLELGNTQ